MSALGAVLAMAPLILFAMETREIYRSLKKLGFDGFSLKREYLYFCSLPKLAADILLNTMLENRWRKRRRS